MMCTQILNSETQHSSSQLELGFGGLHGSFHGISLYCVPPYGNVLFHYFEKKVNEDSQQPAHPTSIYKICCEKSKHSIGRRERKQALWWLSDCKEPLCMPQCFKFYHTKPNYL
jgi:hypothetical protein